MFASRLVCLESLRLAGVAEVSEHGYSLTTLFAKNAVLSPLASTMILQILPRTSLTDCNTFHLKLSRAIRILHRTQSI